MRKLREVLRLRFELKLGYQQIGRSCSIGVSTVHKYLKRAEAAGITWPLPEDWDEARVEALVFPRREPSIAEHNPARTPPDFAAIHEQLRGSKYVTLQLLWEEYRQGNPDAYRYSRFCELYQRWRSKLDVVLRQEHKAGEKMFVDWAGATIPVYDRHTGLAWQAALFVAALGASSYTFAEATRNQQMEAWLRGHVHAFEHFRGIRHRGRGQAVTNEEHRPKSHRAHLEWTPSRMVHWAETIGPNTARLFERIMSDKPHPEMGYRGCLGIRRKSTPRTAWKRRRNGRCSPARAATRASNRS